MYIPKYVLNQFKFYDPMLAPTNIRVLKFMFRLNYYKLGKQVKKYNSFTYVAIPHQ